MESLLQELIAILCTNIGELEDLQDPKNVQDWILRNITIAASGLLTLVQLVQMQTTPFLNRDVWDRFLLDEPLGRRLESLVKDASVIYDTQALLQCLLQHEATFADLGNVFSATLPSVNPL